MTPMGMYFRMSACSMLDSSVQEEQLELQSLRHLLPILSTRAPYCQAT